MFYTSTWIISVIIFSSIPLGLIVILRKPGEKVSWVFLYMTLSIACWQLSNFLENDLSIGLNITKFFLHFDFASAVMVAYFWFLFVSYFSQEKKNSKPFLKKLWLSIAFLFTALSFTDIFFTNINFTNNTIIFDHGYLWPLYAFVVLGFFVAGYIILILNLLKSHDSLKMQNFYIFVGMLISSGTALVINLFLSNILDTDHARIGLYGTIIFIFCAFYAIIRYHMFNIKVVATELFIFVLWVILLFRIFLSDNPRDLLINGVVFCAVVLVGILLVKSVEDEVLLRESLQIANAGQTNLIHIMNHQIKGYLTVNKDIFAEFLAGDYGEMPEIAKPLIEKGLEETEKGVKYVTDILRGASAESGVLLYDMKSIDFAEIVSGAMEKEKDLAEKKGLLVNFHSDAGEYRMMGDATQLAEAVRDLIDNAINYTMKGNIQIALGRKNGKIFFSVKDTGVGITDEDRPKIFKAGGVGTDSIKINTNSSGYGLAFVKGVIEAHKGKVWFESLGAGKGSTFFVELPVA